MLVQLWVAGEGPTIEWSHLARKIVRERRLFFLEGMEIVSYCTKSGHMSRKLGIGEILFQHHVMSDDIDDIQDHRYRMSRRIFWGLKCTTSITYVGLHGPGWLYVLGIAPRADLPL